MVRRGCGKRGQRLLHDMRRPALSGQGECKMADIQCPAPVDATEVELMACEAPKVPVKPTKPVDGGGTPQGGGGGTTNPPQPPKKD